jgi:DNA-binding transcriptional LysR family regulator
VRASVHLNDELWRQLRQGELDLTISSLPTLVPDDFQTIELMQEDLCIVARVEHPLHRKQRLRLADLAQVEWMLPGPDVAARRHVEALLAQRGLPPPRIALEVSNTAGQMRKILRETNLVSLMSESMLAEEANDGLEVLRLNQARIHRAVGITILKQATPQPLASRFVELLMHDAKNVI